MRRDHDGGEAGGRLRADAEGPQEEEEEEERDDEGDGATGRDRRGAPGESVKK